MPAQHAAQVSNLHGCRVAYAVTAIVIQLALMSCGNYFNYRGHILYMKPAHYSHTEVCDRLHQCPSGTRAAIVGVRATAERVVVVDIALVPAEGEYGNTQPEIVTTHAHLTGWYAAVPTNLRVVVDGVKVNTSNTADGHTPKATSFDKSIADVRTQRIICHVNGNEKMIDIIPIAVHTDRIVLPQERADIYVWDAIVNDGKMSDTVMQCAISRY